MEIEKYHLNDQRHFRIYERTHSLSYVPYVVLERVLSQPQLDYIHRVLANHYDETRDIIAAPVRCKSISNRIAELDSLDDLIVNRCLQTNLETWNLEISGVIERRHLVYEVDDDTVWHSDGPFGVNANVPNDVLWRKLSATVCLNDDYEGGEFEMIISSDPYNSYVKIKPSKGSVILFPSFVKHRVAPVSAGKRMTLIYWFCGPRWK